MSWTKVRTSSFGIKLSLNVNTCGGVSQSLRVSLSKVAFRGTFLKQNALEERVLVT